MALVLPSSSDQNQKKCRCTHEQILLTSSLYTYCMLAKLTLTYSIFLKHRKKWATTVSILSIYTWLWCEWLSSNTTVSADHMEWGMWKQPYALWMPHFSSQTVTVVWHQILFRVNEVTITKYSLWIFPLQIKQQKETVCVATVKLLEISLAVFI